MAQSSASRESLHARLAKEPDSPAVARFRRQADEWVRQGHAAVARAEHVALAADHREHGAPTRAQRQALQAAPADTLTGAAAAVVVDEAPPESPDDEEASGDPPSSAAVGPRTAPPGEAHAWIPRGLGNAGLVLALVLDGAGWPDAPTFTARWLGCSDDSVRRQTVELVGLGLVERRDGWLVATPAGRARLRRCDPLPRKLLRPGVAGRTPAVLRAAAVVYGETIGMRAARPGVRGDRERADLAGGHRDLLPKARALLARQGIATFADVRRGRAVLVRASAVLDAAGKPVGSYGRPLGEAARKRIAEAAARRRATPAETGRITPAETDQPMQSPTETLPMQPARPAEASGCEIASLRDGLAAAEPTRKRGTATAAQVLDDLVPGLPASTASKAANAEASTAAAVAELRRMASDPNTVPKLQRMTAPRGIGAVLAAAQVYDRTPKKRAGLASQVARVLDVVQVFALALDVLIGRPKNVGGALRVRLDRALSGKGEPLTRCRASWPIGRFLAAVAVKDGEAEAPRTAAPTSPGFSTTAEARALGDEGRLVAFAKDGAWRNVGGMLRSAVARERGWSPAWLSNRSGVHEDEIRAGIARAAVPPAAAIAPPSRRMTAADAPQAIASGSFDELLRSRGLADLARRATG